MRSVIVDMENSWNPHKDNEAKMIDNIITLITNLVLLWVFLTFVEHDNHETV